MKLIADSGATKADWRLVHDNGNVETALTTGIQPFFQEAGEMAGLLVKELPSGWRQELFIDEIYFYGAGCSAPARQESVKAALHSLFPYSGISVASDLLGSARALFGHSSGLALILGTGSNAALYDGNALTRKAVSLGYLFGDEGSGAYLGKMFLGRYLRAEWPSVLQFDFEKEFGSDINDLLSAVYHHPFPNRYLAGFVPFISKNLYLPEVSQMVCEAFEQFFQIMVKPLTGLGEMPPVAATGSIAVVFEDMLRKAAQKEGIEVERVLKSPADALVSFHT
jgi:N-acetylglucosamine kinase-like BadF-type ATPase